MTEHCELFDRDELDRRLGDKAGRWSVRYPDWDGIPKENFLPTLWFLGRLYLKSFTGERVILTAPVPPGIVERIAAGERVDDPSVQWISSCPYCKQTVPDLHNCPEVHGEVDLRPRPVKADASEFELVPAPPNDSRGLFRKYKIERLDGKDAPGQKHEKCAYFVLDLNHDPYAVPALKAYAQACKNELPQLARDLEAVASTHEVPEGPGIAAEFFMAEEAKRGTHAGDDPYARIARQRSAYTELERKYLDLKDRVRTLTQCESLKDVAEALRKLAQELPPW